MGWPGLLTQQCAPTPTSDGAEYYSSDEEEWFECNVVGTDADGNVSLTVNGTERFRKVMKEELSTRLRTKPVVKEVWTKQLTQGGLSAGDDTGIVDVYDTNWGEFSVQRSPGVVDVFFLIPAVPSPALVHSLQPRARGLSLKAHGWSDPCNAMQL